MKKISSIVLTFALLVIVNGCTKDKENPIEDLGSSITAFTNQTGEPNETANGLQAQVVDNNNGNTVDFYGNFNALGEPDVLNSIRVTRPNSDTVVNYIINPVTKNFERATFEVNGQVLDLIVKFDFPQGDTTMILSHYNYNWVTGVSELYYAGEYYLSNGMVGEEPVFVRQLRLSETNFDWVTAGVGVGVGITIAEIALATTSVIGGTSLVGTAVGAVAVAVAAVSSTVILTMVVVGVALVTISGANASDVLPQNIPTPVGTPVSLPNQPLPDPLPENPCINNPVSVSATANEQGEIAAVAAGGTGDYTYYWSNGYTQTTGANFSTIAPSVPGTYSVVVADENDCAAVAYATTTEGYELQIGQDGPAGGVVVYDEGNYDKGWRFVEMTKQPIGNAKWGCLGVDINTGASYEYGSGLEKTQSIIASCPDAGIAARLCESYSQNGYDDWFLPSTPSVYLTRMYGLTQYVVSPAIPLPTLPTYVWSSATSQDVWSPTVSEVPADVNLGGAIDTFSNGTLVSLGAYLNKDDVYGVYATRRF